jgi:hypothetical protein
VVGQRIVERIAGCAIVCPEHELISVVMPDQSLKLHEAGGVPSL